MWESVPSNVCPMMTQISLRIRAVWVESSLSIWQNVASLSLDIQNAPIEASRKYTYVILTPLNPIF